MLLKNWICSKSHSASCVTRVLRAKVMNRYNFFRFIKNNYLRSIYWSEASRFKRDSMVFSSVFHEGVLVARICSWRLSIYYDKLEL